MEEIIIFNKSIFLTFLFLLIITLITDSEEVEA